MPTRYDIRHAAEGLADTVLAGEFAAASMAKRAGRHFIKTWPGFQKLAQQLEEQFGKHTRPARREIVSAIESYEPLRRWLRGSGSGKFDFDPGTKAKMCAARGNPKTWQLPKITTRIGLAHWLRLSESELLWFARPWRDSGERLLHYQQHWIAKRRGGHRLIEKPKDALKLIQQQILHRILDHIPPHSAVHSFRSSHSVISYATSHCAKPVLLKIDIAEFFPSLSAGRVRALFRTAGYPDAVANLLADLCCTITPEFALTQPPTPLSWVQKKRLQSPHLPQGAPTSPALSNLLGYRLDCRLAGLAKSVDASYTRYADDLAFSGDRRIGKLAPTIAAILIEEGFTPNHRKTRSQRKSQRQRLAGMIINSNTPNIARKDYDQLKAILHNCVTGNPETEDRFGLGAEIFRQHLQGRIAWIRSLNPNRAEKLQGLFARIDW